MTPPGAAARSHARPDARPGPTAPAPPPAAVSAGPWGSAATEGVPGTGRGADGDSGAGAEGAWETGGGGASGAGAVPHGRTDAGHGGRSWPLAGRPTVVRGWEPPTGPYGPGHRGVDLAAAPGDRVLAAAAGRVSYAGPVAGRGVLSIEIDGGGAPPLRTTYEPVRALVRQGERVRAGQSVGVLEGGPFHCPAGCLHWGLRRADAYLDPLSLLPPSLLRRGPSRLLPVFGVPEPDERAPARGRSLGGEASRQARPSPGGRCSGPSCAAVAARVSR
ncbi:M23 family metallopeptidase [Streptomyces pratensis]